MFHLSVSPRGRVQGRLPARWGLLVSALYSVCGQPPVYSISRTFNIWEWRCVFVCLAQSLHCMYRKSCPSPKPESSVQHWCPLPASLWLSRSFEAHCSVVSSPYHSKYNQTKGAFSLQDAQHLCGGRTHYWCSLLVGAHSESLPVLLLHLLLLPLLFSRRLIVFLSPDAPQYHTRITFALDFVGLNIVWVGLSNIGVITVAFSSSHFVLCQLPRQLWSSLKSCSSSCASPHLPTWPPWFHRPMISKLRVNIP